MPSALWRGGRTNIVVSSKINAVKQVCVVHPQYKSCYLIPEIDRKTFAKADGIVLISENCLGQFFEFFPEYKENTYVVPNILSAELVRKKAEAETVVLQKANLNFCTVCRCDIQVKGLDRLLNVF